MPFVFICIKIAFKKQEHDYKWFIIITLSFTVLFQTKVQFATSLSYTKLLIYVALSYTIQPYLKVPFSR